VTGPEGSVLVLDAGTGIRRLGLSLDGIRRVDLLLTHLHMDHIQGLGFFRPLRLPETEVHVWGPAGTSAGLRARLDRYLSPPLFPVYLRDLDARVHFHQVPRADFEIGEFRVRSAHICHPDPTVGYRIDAPDGSLAYLSDHEPALGAKRFPLAAEWTSGYELAEGVDLLIHDAQYTREEYAERVGWGHSSIDDAFAFAALAGVRTFVPFHHDPGHTDQDLDRLFAATGDNRTYTVAPGTEGAEFVLG
jgi:phosphoribosyl 1,2-cyclic phosphodiesterase